MRTDNVKNEIPEATELGVLDDEVAATGLAIALRHRWNVAATGAQARVVADAPAQSGWSRVRPSCCPSASCRCVCDHRVCAEQGRQAEERQPVAAWG
jgi:hypothetical protein